MLLRPRRWLHRLLDCMPAALPCACALCGANADEALCSGCRQQFFDRRRHRCTCCAVPLPLDDDRMCGDCLQRRPAFDATVVATDYAAPVDQLVLALKFGNRLALAPLFANMLHSAWTSSDCLPPPNRLAPVPLGRRRLAERGFNQALEIARSLSQASSIPLDMQLVVRQRETYPQALLHPDARHRNIRKAFTVPGAGIDLVKGMHVGVVDDVMTTGKTLDEIAATLKRFGATRVTNFVFARTPPR